MSSFFGFFLFDETEKLEIIFNIFVHMVGSNGGVGQKQREEKRHGDCIKVEIRLEIRIGQC